MIKVEINSVEFFVQPNMSVLEACKYVGIHVPRFCYHETLSVAGNCRMCLVEIGNSPKPVASCALPILNNMKIFVDTPLVKKARENVIELLLLNHPLDCPICDQAGECDLQDQTKQFGSNHHRFFFTRRGVEDKNCGSLIKTIMTRCIHCTRCVRFSSEIAGVDFFGTLNRGTSTEIGSYTVKSFNSEISGNVIDLCPVGALTSKPYAFKARPWEARISESLDITDSTGSNIYVNFKESEIIRVLPKINNQINLNLISDKTRFSYDNNSFNRLISLKDNHDSLKNWSGIIPELEALLSNKKVSFLLDSSLDLDSLLYLKLLANKNKNLSLHSFSDSYKKSSNIFVNWLLNKIEDLHSTSKICFIISSNIRFESSIINAKLRLKFSKENINFFNLGLKYKSNFELNFVNLSLSNLLLFFEGKNKILSKFFLKFKNPIFCVGENLDSRGLSIITINNFLKQLQPSSIVLGILKNSNSYGLRYTNIGIFDKNSILSSSVIVCINLKETLSLSSLLSSFKKMDIENKVFWLNTHDTRSLNKSLIDYKIPLLSEYEEEQLHINLEGRIQKTSKVLSGIGDSRSLKQLLKILYNNSFSTTNEADFYTELLLSPKKFNKNFKLLSNLLIKDYYGATDLFNFYPIKSVLEDFYLSTKSTKFSKIMSQCSQDFRKSITNF